MNKIQLIQEILSVSSDGIWGPKSQSALDKDIEDSKTQPQRSASSNTSGATVVSGLASSFADPADVAAFKKCKAQGNSDEVCFGRGDNGIGYTGIDTTNLEFPFVAVQPDYMQERWGSLTAAAGKAVNVTINGKTHQCVVGDRMPWIKNTKNGAVIDLAPGAQKLFGLTPPFLVPAKWSWA